MKRIILHVGTHKTGSSTIQETLFRQRHRLTEAGLHYLSIGANHWDLYSAFMDEPWEWFENRRRGLDRAQVDARNRHTLDVVRAEIENTPCPWVMISAEHLSMLPSHAIEALRDWLAPLGEVQVVYFVRQIESWIASDSQQCAKVGIRARPTPYTVAIQRLFDFPVAWLEAFGKRRVSLVRFEDALQTGLTDTLLALAGLPGLAALGMEEMRFNESISAEAVECFYCLNRIAPVGKAGRNEHLVGLLMSMPGSKYRAAALSQAEVEDHNRKMNRLRARYHLDLYPALHYRGEDDGRAPFSEDALYYLVNTLNDTMNRLEALESQVSERVGP
ncbi:hypothetical protein ACLD02_10835 [Alloalcanivorax sp. C16-2]|uniref:hypothetical protein n=1 Tax=Alloalcanivorax sp. C16-2 TaxID=3390052 RepID=UPI003970BF00